MSRFQHIPTTIITGFLGAGKTTAIAHLLKQRSPQERWAVIVNEFGQIGIDGDLLPSDGVTIREIPGGCLCCVGSQSFSVGLNQLIKTAKPDRLLIEPTGLGHPARLIEQLRGEYYASVIDLKAVITLLDARQLNDTRYTGHETYVDQVQMADILVANKADTYSEQDRQRFYDYAAALVPSKQKLAIIEQGRLAMEWLDLPASLHREARFASAHDHRAASDHHHPVSSQANWLQLDGRGDGYVSKGWRVQNEVVFSSAGLRQWLGSMLDELSLERVKGIMHTDEGWLGINLTRHESAFTHTAENAQSRLEIIAAGDSLPETLDHQLQALQIQE